MKGRISAIRYGFTLIELLVVVGIMGLLGTISIGGYQAMQRGMAERGTMDTVNNFIRAAYQRAQIDRQPTAIYFWNETLRKGDDYSADKVVGRAVAIRRSGRVTFADDSYVYDEFADLERAYAKDDATGNEVKDGSKSDTEGNTMYLYPIDDLSDIANNAQLKRTVVYQRVYNQKLPMLHLAGQNGKLADSSDNGGDGQEVKTYAFKVAKGDDGSVKWEAGMAYGCEFARLELPQGFIFGSDYSSSVEDPVKPQGTLVFAVGQNSGNGVQDSSALKNRSGKISVSALRPGTTGEITPQPVGTSVSPTEENL